MILCFFLMYSFQYIVFNVCTLFNPMIAIIKQHIIIIKIIIIIIINLFYFNFLIIIMFNFVHYAYNLILSVV